MIRVYRYRLYPTRAQDARMRWTLERLRELYNAALEERREAYRRQEVTLSAYDQAAQIKGVRDVRPEYADVYAHLMQDAISRLDLAFRGFFRRIHLGKTPGYPRFRGRGRYSTFTFKDPKSKTRWLTSGGKRIDLPKIGKVKIKLHRQLEGRLKQVTITLDGDGRWYACMCCDRVQAKTLPAASESIGIDVGIATFAALSNGELIGNPRHHETAQAKLSRAHRAVDRRRNKRSNRRRKAVAVLRTQYARVRRTRLDFHHKVSLSLVRRFATISVEDLNVSALARGMLSKQINDAAWAQFIRILASKAACAGRELIRVNPRGTSQICSECGAEVRKDLGVRIHSCPCGYVADRDINAARNINRLGRSLRGAVSVDAALNREAGTQCASAEGRSRHKHGHVRVWANGDRAAEIANSKNEEVRPEKHDDRPFKVEPWAVRQ